MRCENHFIKNDEILEAPSEYLIFNKNYCEEFDVGKLKAPTDTFFTICEEKIQIFSKIWREYPHIYIQNITNSNKDFYNIENPCLDHNKMALNIMVLVLIRKHCTWLAEKYIKRKYNNARNPNWRILLQ